MGLKEKFKKFFTRAPEETAIQSDLKRFNSDSKRFKALQQRFKSLESDSNLANNSEKYTRNYENQAGSTTTKLSRPIKLQKESLQLGMAAGYTGKSLREIESSLARIESQMASKDWFVSNFEDTGPEILKVLNHIKNRLEKHDSIALNRFKAIQSALNRLSSTAKKAPEPIKQKLVKDIESIRSSLPLTSKMKKLVEVVQEHGKISYDELAQNLGISRSSLRGLLSNTIKRTGKIERYSVGGKGYVRYVYPKTTQIDEI